MRPEAPTPSPLPEILYDRAHQPVVMDVDFDLTALAALIDNIRGDRRSRLHRWFILKRIRVQGGLAVQPMPLDKVKLYPIPLNSRKGMYIVFDSAYHTEVEGDWLAGSYAPKTQTISLFPDTLLLSEIADTAEREEIGTYGISSIPGRIRSDAQHKTEQFLIEELDHSSELLTFVPPILPVWRTIETRAKGKRSDPHLQSLANQAISVRPLISDEKVLELYTLAHERYQASKGQG